MGIVYGVVVGMMLWWLPERRSVSTIFLERLVLMVSKLYCIVSLLTVYKYKDMQNKSFIYEQKDEKIAWLLQE